MMLVGVLPRHRIPLVATVLLAVLVTLLPGVPDAAHADSGTEAAFVAATNQARAAEGLAPLTVASDLTAVARSHSSVMAGATNLHHNPNLGSDVAGWQKVGENVGRGPSVTSIQDAFMASPGHRSNVVDGAWSQIGIGVVVEDGSIWVTVLFRQPSGAPAPAEPPAPAAPAPEPKAIEEPTPPARDGAGGDPVEPDPQPPVDEPSQDLVPLPPPEHDRIAVTMARLDASER